MGEETLYEVLGVSSGASVEEIKRAYRQRCVEFHPDGLPDHREEIVRFANERMKLITLAWSVLSDPGKRRDYDETLKKGRPETPADSALQEEMNRLSRERDAAREEARRYQAQTQNQDEGGAVVEELRRIRAFQRMTSREARERLNRSGATGSRNTPYEDYLEEEERREAERIERAKSPAQRAREAAEREERRAQRRAESRNLLWGFLWRHSAAVKRAEVRIRKVEYFAFEHRAIFLFPIRLARLLVYAAEKLLQVVGYSLGIAIAAAVAWWIFMFVYNL